MTRTGKGQQRFLLPKHGRTLTEIRRAERKRFYRPSVTTHCQFWSEDSNPLSVPGDRPSMLLATSKKRKDLAAKESDCYARLKVSLRPVPDTAVPFLNEICHFVLSVGS
jgi:hypothetical protein